MQNKVVNVKVKKGDSLSGFPAGSVVVKNVAGRTIEVGEPRLALFPGEIAVFAGSARGVAEGLANKTLKSVQVVDAYEEPKSYISSKKKKNDVPAPDEETVSETVASEGPESSVQLGLVDTESSPSDQQEGN